MDLLLPNAKITGLPRSLHEGTELKLRNINYFFGPNGSGKSLSLKKVTEQAKNEIRSKNLQKNGYFAQYITATPQANLYQDQFQLLDRRATDFDLENVEISGQAFYQHLQDYPEIVIKVRDALQKYLGRYPNVVRRGINITMSFLREEESDVPGYSPQSESDGLKRLSLLLSYIYHPKCKFLAVDEPELYLHPDMISFLLQEIHEEIKLGKQYVFATHSPEIIRIGSGQIYAYCYFNLKNTLAESHIIQASDSNAIKIIENLGYLLDVNRRAFLYAPITLFVEGIADEVVYNHLREKNKIKWHRRIFMANTGGVIEMFDFWRLWTLFDKEVRVIIDYPSSENNSDATMQTISKFCTELDIDAALSLTVKIEKLAERKIYIAPYNDVLKFDDKNIALKDLKGASDSLNFSKHIVVLNNALKIDEPKRKQIRGIEEEWLISLAQEIVGELIKHQDKQDALKQVKDKLKRNHPNIEIHFDSTSEYLMTIHFNVGKDRILFLRLSSDITKTKIGILQ